MSKKDLLERLNRAPSEAPRTPRRKAPAEEPAAPPRRPENGAVTQRVGKRVLRRSKRNQSEPETPETPAPAERPAVRRRPARAASAEAPPSDPHEQEADAANQAEQDDDARDERRDDQREEDSVEPAPAELGASSDDDREVTETPPDDAETASPAAEEAEVTAAGDDAAPDRADEASTAAEVTATDANEPAASAEPEPAVDETSEGAMEPESGALPESGTVEQVAAAKVGSEAASREDASEEEPQPASPSEQAAGGGADLASEDGDQREAEATGAVQQAEAGAPEAAAETSTAPGEASAESQPASAAREREATEEEPAKPASRGAGRRGATASEEPKAEERPPRPVDTRHRVRRRKRESATTRSPEPAAPRSEPTEQKKEDPPSGSDDRQFPGLGPAVVMPPPGYDPTNPMAYRAQQEADQGAAARPGAGPGGPAATPGGAQPAASKRGRRRVEPGAGAQTDFRGRGRRDRSGPGGGSGRGYDRRPTRKQRRKSGPKQASPAPKAAKRKVKVDNVISVRDLAMQLGVKASVVIRHLMDLGTMAKVNEMLDLDTAGVVAAEFDYEVDNVGFQEENYLETVEESIEEGNLQERPPVVTIMGHVDHGKTTLLDTIRSSRVAAGEAGGITQHIGAYQVDVDGRKITFIDTPGHEAFSSMRARGASVTDIVVLVVAADDGVQPQTEEAIQHAKAAGVPIVVAVNKMDKPGVTAEAIKTRVSEFDLLPEEWGGDTLYVPISALKGEGIDDLLEALLLQADVVETRANPERFAEGIVLEAKMERGRGAVASVLIQRGTLNRGDHVVLGSAFGKVRAMLDHTGANIKKAGPSTPVELFGLSELPEVGDTVNAVKSEKNARALADHRAVAKRQEAMAKNKKKTADDLFAQAAMEDRETLLLILKSDVGGSLQALKAAIEDIEVPGAEVRILLASVGDITESDVNLAASDNAKVIGFNVKVDARARKAAQQLGVEPELYTIIYEVLDRVEREMKGLLAPVYELVREGTLEVRQLFRISRIGTVAGSYVIDGKVARNHQAKVLRDGKVVWEGKVSSLKRFKDDVREVSAGYECGLSLEGYDDLEEGDLVETYSEQVVEPV